VAEAAIEPPLPQGEAVHIRHLEVAGMKPVCSARSACSTCSACSACSTCSAYAACPPYAACSAAARLHATSAAVSGRASIRLTHATPFGSATGKRQQATSRDEQRSKPTGRAAHGLTPNNGSKEDSSGATLNDSPESWAVFAKILRLQMIRRIPSVPPFELGLDFGPAGRITVSKSMRPRGS
jgi:hypothetical protein